MTAFVIDLTRPRERAMIASDTLQYSLSGGTYRPIGFRNKIIPVPSAGALFGAGIDEVTLRAARAVLKRFEDAATHELVVDALPEILRAETRAFARRRNIWNADKLAMIAASWVGWSESRSEYEMVVFANEGDFAPQRGFQGFIGVPNVPAAFLPANWGKLDDEPRIAAAMRAIKRFTEAHGATLGMPPIGGEIVMHELDRETGWWNGVIGSFDDAEETARQVAETQAHLEDLPDGHDMLNRLADRPAVLAKLEQALRGSAPVPSIAATTAPMSRQQRRASEKAARKAARRAA